MAAMGAALATMVANLSAHKRGWDDRWEEFSDWADRGKQLHDEALRLIDDDTAAFNQVMAAMRLPRQPEDAAAARARAIQEATVAAIEVPFRVMQLGRAALDVARAMAEIGNPSSVSDAGVGALAARAAVQGAFLNVRINCPGLTDRARAADYLARGQAMEAEAIELERAILATVAGKLAP